MKIGRYEISLTITKDKINEQAVIKAVNEVIPKNLPNSTGNKIARIKEVRNLGKHFPGEMKYDDSVVQLVHAKDFVEKHWR